jgi:RNA-binding protein YhbY
MESRVCRDLLDSERSMRDVGDQLACEIHARAAQLIGRRAVLGREDAVQAPQG